GTNWVHRVSGVAHQGDAPKGPARKRVFVHQRKFVDGFGSAYDCGNVDPVPAPAVKVLGKGAGRHFAVPVGFGKLRLRHTQFCNPVNQRTALLAQGFGYGIADEFLILMAGHEHAAPVEVRLAFRDGTPKHATGVTQLVDILMEMTSHGRMNTVSGDKNICLARFGLARESVDEIGGYAAVILLQG